MKLKYILAVALSALAFSHSPALANVMVITSTDITDKTIITGRVDNIIAGNAGKNDKFIASLLPDIEDRGLILRQAGADLVLSGDVSIEMITEPIYDIEYDLFYYGLAAHEDMLYAPRGAFGINLTIESGTHLSLDAYADLQSLSIQGDFTLDLTDNFNLMDMLYNPDSYTNANTNGFGFGLFCIEEIDTASQRALQVAVQEALVAAGGDTLFVNWLDRGAGHKLLSIDRVNFSVPEPSTASLGLVGLSALLLRRRRKTA